MKYRLIDFLLILAAIFAMFLWVMTFAGLMASGHYITGVYVGLLGFAVFTTAIWGIK